MVLREPFSAFTVIEVAWFLRLAYCLEEAQAERDLQQMGSCLSAVLRMAHALDAPRLLKKVEKHIAGKVGVHHPCPQLGPAPAMWQTCDWQSCRARQGWAGACQCNSA